MREWDVFNIKLPIDQMLVGVISALNIRDAEQEAKLRFGDLRYLRIVAHI